MKFVLILTVVLLSGCAQFGKTSGTAMDPPQAGNYCFAPVDGACLGCDISCPAKARASCKTGGTTQGVCTRAAVCQCQ